MNNNKIIYNGLYIHIPFCHSICPYCDFKKMVGSTNLQHEYIISLIKELKTKNLNNITTIYLGGGTPTALSHNDLKLLLSTINELIDMNNIKEFTIETNPQDINIDLINILKEYKISRISIGVQTLVPRLQKIINRFITIDELQEKLSLLYNNNFKNLNLDLIYGIPSETMDELLYDLNNFARLQTSHLSCYSLILEENTIFYHQYLQNKIKITSDDELSKMYDLVNKILSNHNYHRYEVSNFSINKNTESLHNLLYWNQNTYLGIGVSACGFDGKTRYKNTNKISDYITNINHNLFDNIILEKETLTKEELIDEFIMLSLRKEEGFNIKEIENKYQINLFEYYPNINNLIKQELLVLENNNIKINSNYLYVSENIVVKLLLR